MVNNTYVLLVDSTLTRTDPIRVAVMVPETPSMMIKQGSIVPGINAEEDENIDWPAPESTYIT